jgi:glyoxylase-like metal-dependent hydrolase (beta-lactamase superfamily II)
VHGDPPVSAVPAAGELIVLPTPFPVGPVNVWVLRGAPLTLIDAGPRTPEALAALESGLAALGLRVEDLELLVLTHQHHDHVGQAALLKRRSGCAVAAHELLAERLPALRLLQDEELAYADALMRLHGVDRRAREQLLDIYRSRHGYAEPVTVDVALADGHVVEAGGRRLRVSFRPGHSPTDTLLTDDAARTAYAGDHLLSHISSNPLAHFPLDGPADPRERGSALLAYLDSLHSTAREPHELLLTGHGARIRDHATLANERIRLHHDRAEQVRDALVAGPSSAGAIARVLWPGVDVSQTFLALCEVLGALDLLARDDVLSVGEDETGALRYALR